MGLKDKDTDEKRTREDQGQLIRKQIYGRLTPTRLQQHQGLSVNSASQVYVLVYKLLEAIYREFSSSDSFLLKSSLDLVDKI